ncbi:MAG: alanine--tRNA ligase [Chloroflexi bacterium]|nr:alanine--tRNA ligase [Chloroflexota bacterium]
MTFPADQVRALFLDFFADRDHLILPSSSLVPVDDPSVLFTSAGMQQFKPYYSGAVKAPHPRIATAQKCFRTSDIESVGDASHLTLFEMLGNFTFGDYFKRESIIWAYELLTRGLGLDPEQIWVTCFAGEGNLPRDEESYRIWRDEIGIPEERIEFHGRAENFWGPTGDSGPCGPDSEIHYRLRPPPPGVAETGTASDDDRFLELWNLVFNQFEQQVDGTLADLAAPGVDTGAGFERWVVLMQGKNSVYETDLYADIVAVAADILRPDTGDLEQLRALRTVAEHGRALAFLIGDGVLPSNDGRGFVLRRLLRRAVGAARQFGVTEPLMASVSEAAIETMQAAYPEVGRRRSEILSVVSEEEERFQATLRHAIGYLDRRVVGESGINQIDGRQAFWLHDTLGLTIENLKVAAAARGLSVDEPGFETAMEEQRRRSRRAARAEKRLPQGPGPSKFCGYESETLESTRLQAIFAGGESVDSLGSGEDCLLVLAATPFYAESGGQVGDSGALSWESGRARVNDTQQSADGTIFHFAKITSGTLRSGQELSAAVDVDRRAAIRRNHTATHLLHAALRSELGDHARQAGSLVAPDHLRFDFNHSAALAPEQLINIERSVNRQALAAIAVSTEQTVVQEAVARGAMALFGEKYGEQVRLVSIGDRSLELCGGTHLENTAQMGLFHITAQENIGSGLRRIEAVTGEAAAERLRGNADELEAAARLLESSVGEVVDRTGRLLEEQAGLQRELARLREAHANSVAARLLEQNPPAAGGIRVLGLQVVTDGLASLADVSQALKSQLGADFAFVLAGESGGRAQVLASASRSALEAGVDSAGAVRVAAACLGGGGGGNPAQARGGGPDGEKTGAAIAAGLEELRRQLGRDRN